MNLNTYKEVYSKTFSVDLEEVEQLEYQSIVQWDSVGHMELMAELEEAFDIMLDTDDIIDFSSYKKGIEILSKYGVVLE